MTHWSSAFTRMAKWIIQHLQALLVNNPLMGRSYVWFIATDNWGPDSAVIGSMAHNSQKVEGKCSSWRLCEIMSARKVESCSSSWNCQSQTKKKKKFKHISGASKRQNSESHETSGLSVWFDNNFTSRKKHGPFLNINKPQGLDEMQVKMDRLVIINRKIK